MMVRTRIPPSPTGALHLGTARTALFNFLFARQKQGKFILRIEDTDKSRSKPEFEDDIKDGLSWLGLAWDEFYRQSERTLVYQKYLSLLLEKGSAFWCAHSQEETKGNVHFCPDPQRNRPQDKADQAIIRFKTPRKKEVRFEDIVRGDLSFQSDELGDFSLAKNEETPLYNLAVVIDDYEMKISHVVRGEDHISNTPKQILLQEALGFPLPMYAHLPLILGPDRSKLSKRHGATAIADYRAKGYLPQAMVNAMAFLGWNPGDDREFFTLEELIKEFSLERVKKGGSIFNIDRLKFINRHYLNALSPEKYAERATPFFLRRYGSPGFALHMVRSSNSSTLSEVVEEFDSLINFHDYPSQLLIWKKTDRGNTQDALQRMKTVIEKFPEEVMKDKNNIKEGILRAIQGEEDRGAYLWPLRVALYGKEASPDPFKGVAILGKHETLARITKAIKKLDTE